VTIGHDETLRANDKSRAEDRPASVKVRIAAGAGEQAAYDRAHGSIGIVASGCDGSVGGALACPLALFFDQDRDDAGRDPSYQLGIPRLSGDDR
jgi:hypothetical protein